MFPWFIGGFGQSTSRRAQVPHRQVPHRKNTGDVRRARLLRGFLSVGAFSWQVYHDGAKI
jgi:hypothetical protein